MTVVFSASDIMLDHCGRRQSKQILLVQTGYGAPQYLLRSLSVANMSGVSVRPRGGGSWCVLSGRWAIVGRLVHVGVSGPRPVQGSLGTCSSGSKSKVTGCQRGYRTDLSSAHFGRAKSCFYTLTSRLNIWTQTYKRT